MGLFDRFKKDAKVQGIEINEETGIVYQPIDGTVITLAEIGDGVFSEGILGRGCGLIPDGEVLYSPISGKISTVAETKHAVGITGNDGTEMLIHVGLETVSMNGKGFQVKVKEGDVVKAGQELMTFSLAEIDQAEGVSRTSAVLVINADDLPACELLFEGKGNAGGRLLKVR